MLEAAFIASGVALGFAVGRWWAIGLAVPAGLLSSQNYDFEGFSDLEVGVLMGTGVAVSIVAGVLLRKLVRRSSG